MLCNPKLRAGFAAALCLAFVSPAIGQTTTRSNKSTQSTALVDAARDGDLRKVKHLLAKGAPVNQGRNQFTALMAAAQLGRADIAKVLLERGASVNAICDGQTALVMASIKESPDVIRMLVKQGASVDQRYVGQFGNGETPLMNAVMCRNVGNVQALLSAGAKVNTRNAHGDTALSLAVKSLIFITHVGPIPPKASIVKLLLDHGADLSIRDRKGFTALQIATEKNLADILALFNAATTNSVKVHPTSGKQQSIVIRKGSDADERPDPVR